MYHRKHECRCRQSNDQYHAQCSVSFDIGTFSNSVSIAIVITHLQKHLGVYEKIPPPPLQRRVRAKRVWLKYFAKRFLLRPKELPLALRLVKTADLPQRIDEFSKFSDRE
jgi:hypothetical protein